MTFRKIQQGDNPVMKDIISSVMTSYDCVGEGYSIEDPEVANMYAAYNNSRSIYYILEESGKVLGGGGIAPLVKGKKETCELKKMYFLKEARGKGLGAELLELLLKEAKRLGYNQCYLETVERMAKANLLYKRFGFTKLSCQLGDTGHSGCDTYYSKTL